MRLGFRGKLIISYAAVIFLTLSLAILLFWFVVQQIQSNQRLDSEKRLANLTQNVSDAIVNPNRFAYTDSNTYQQLLSSYAQILNVRILLIDAQHDVDADTWQNASQNVRGQKLTNYNLIPRDNQAYPGNLSLGGINFIYYARPGPCIRISNSIPPSTDTRQDILAQFKIPGNIVTQQSALCRGINSNSVIESDLLLAVEEGSLNSSWNNFLQGMVLAALTALVVAIVVAFFIARGITRPLTRITQASEAIAKGDYNQRIDVSNGSNDEIGRLSSSFNNMAQEVARNQQTMRDFVANVSHELKTPLTSIQGFSQAILDGTADDQVMLDHSAEVIHNEAARMKRLVEELLDLSRIESGQVELTRQDINLNDLLYRVVVKLEPLALGKEILLKSEFQPGLSKESWIPVQGDSDRLEQIFTNLIDNAIKYSNRGGEIYIKLGLSINLNDGFKGDNNDKWAIVRIVNVGPLIPQEEMPRIFERFYKLDKSRSRKKGDSTGLGLAIVRELIEAHHGHIQVESRPIESSKLSDYTFAADSNANPINQGVTTFSVYLPLGQQPITDDTQNSYVQSKN